MSQSLEDPNLIKLQQEWNISTPELDCIVTVAGSFNSGKTTLINAILNDEGLLPSADVPTTALPTYIQKDATKKYIWKVNETELTLKRADVSKVVKNYGNKGGEMWVYTPNMFSSHCLLVDLPGSLSTIDAHSILHKRTIKKSDVVVYTMRFDMAMRNTDREELKEICTLLPIENIFLVVTHCKKHTVQEIEQMKSYIQKETPFSIGPQRLFFVDSISEQATHTISSFLHTLTEYVTSSFEQIKRNSRAQKNSYLKARQLSLWATEQQALNLITNGQKKDIDTKLKQLRSAQKEIYDLLATLKRTLLSAGLEEKGNLRENTQHFCAQQKELGAQVDATDSSALEAFSQQFSTTLEEIITHSLHQSKERLENNLRTTLHDIQTLNIDVGDSFSLYQAENFNLVELVDSIPTMQELKEMLPWDDLTPEIQEILGEVKGLNKGLGKAAPWIEIIDFLLKYKQSIQAKRTWKYTLAKIIYSVNGMSTSLFKRWWTAFTGEIIEYMRADLLEESAKYIEVLESHIQHDTQTLKETESRLAFLSARLIEPSSSI